MATIVSAQGKFEAGMGKGLGMLKEAKTAAALTETSAFFERVADDKCNYQFRQAPSLSAKKLHILPLFHTISKP